MGSAVQPGALTPVIRPASPEDRFSLSELFDLLGYPCPPEEIGGRLLALRQDANQSLLVADVKGAAVGMVACDLSYYVPLGAPTCRITALAVAAHAQRVGVGRLLLREAESLARSAGAVRIELTSAAHRLEAHTFYRACGYGDGALRFVKHLGDA